MNDLKAIYLDSVKSNNKNIINLLDKINVKTIFVQNGFLVFDELNNSGADILIAHIGANDLKESFLFPFIKAIDKIANLPLALIISVNENIQNLASFVNIADLIIDEIDFEQKPDETINLVLKLIEQSRIDGFVGNNCKSFLSTNLKFKENNLVENYQNMIVNLLTEKMISRLCKKLTDFTTEPNTFVENYFLNMQNYINSDLMGIVVATSIAQFAVFELNKPFAQDDLILIVDKTSKSLGLELEFNKLDIRGIISESSPVGIGEFEVLPVNTQNLGLVALIFACKPGSSLTSQERYILEHLQIHMHSAVELMLAKFLVSQLSKTMNSQTGMDSVTGIYNLEFLIGFLQQQLLFSARLKLPTGLLFIDLDNFSQLSNIANADIVNQILLMIAQKLALSIRASDLLARYGFDQFVVVVPNTDVNGTKILAQKLRQEIEGLFPNDKLGIADLKITASIGCSQFDGEDLNPETLIRDAKIAVIQAKELGKNQVFI